MKAEDLYLEYARVIKMCEGTAVKPWHCIKVDGRDIFEDHPIFDSHPNYYEFAVAILEGKPVFIGDTVYHKQSGIERIISKSDLVDDFENNFTWQQPKQKRTFMLNDIELPCPIDGVGPYPISVRGITFYFNSAEDRSATYNAIIDTLIEARGKQ